jgi:Flp pilus assembly protein TadB
MRINFETPGRPQSLVARIVAAVLATLAFGAAMMFSVLVFAFLALAALVFGGYFWWKTRALRRAMREQMRGQGFEEAPDGDTPGRDARSANVIEGEAVRVDEDRLRLK